MAKKPVGTATTATDTLKVSEKKWGRRLIKAGWTVIPNTILERQQALGLDATDVNILLHIISYWWEPEGRPFPSKVTIAKAMGVDPSTVRRRIADMEKGGLIKREERRIAGVGSRTNIYHLDGLIQAATPYAQEKIQQREKQAQEKAAAAARKGRPRLELVRDED